MAASLSATSLTFTSPIAGTPSAGQTVTLSSTGTGALTLSSIAASGDFTQTNNCSNSLAAGSNCIITVIFTPTVSGTRTGTLTVTDNASNSPQSVSLSGSSPASTVSLTTEDLNFPIQTMVGTPSTSQSVTLANIGSQGITISDISVTGDFSQTNTCGTGLSVGGSCTLTVTLTPTAVGARKGTLTITDNSNGVPGTTQTINLTGAGFTNNSADVNVTFGLPGGTLDVTTNYYNAIFTTITICVPGTTTCTTVPNVLVDTGSVGLRVLSDQMPGLTLPPITDSSNNPLYECVEYGDTSYSWGPVQLATIKIGGETASETPGFASETGVPIQVITAGGTAPSQVSNGTSNIAMPCLSGGGPSNNSAAALGANGILGIANYMQDCGPNCESSTTVVSPYPYMLCDSTGNSCQLTTAPADIQVWNPVSAFASADNNGEQLQLPAIPGPPDIGAVSVAGRLVFGINTQTCPSGADPGCVKNSMAGAQLYSLDGNGSFPSIVFKGVTYLSSNVPSYLDSGSQALYILDAATLGTSNCTTGGTNLLIYCPGTTLNFSNITVTGNNGTTSPPFSLSIADALTLFQNQPTYAAFDNIGGDSGSSLSNDSFDIGLPFFFGRNVFVGIEDTSNPNGYYGF